VRKCANYGIAPQVFIYFIQDIRDIKKDRTLRSFFFDFEGFLDSCFFVHYILTFLLKDIILPLNC